MALWPVGIVKKGKKIDVLKSVVPDPDTVPANDSKEAKALMSNWRMDKLKEVSYTQFWVLVREGHVEKVGDSICLGTVAVACALEALVPVVLHVLRHRTTDIPSLPDNGSVVWRLDHIGL